MDFKFQVIVEKQKSPDLSFLGTFSMNRPNGGIWIDREKNKLYSDGKIIKDIQEIYIHKPFRYYIPNLDRISVDKWHEVIHRYHQHLKYDEDWYFVDIECILNISQDNAPFHSAMISVKNIVNHDADEVIEKMKAFLWNTNKDKYYSSVAESS